MESAVPHARDLKIFTACERATLLTNRFGECSRQGSGLTLEVGRDGQPTVDRLSGGSQERFSCFRQMNRGCLADTFQAVCKLEDTSAIAPVIKPPAAVDTL